MMVARWKLMVTLCLWLALVTGGAALAGVSTRPVADGSIVDSNSDGIGDFAADGINSVLVGFNTVLGPGEHRGVYEFDLREFRTCAGGISATLHLSLTGTHLAGSDPNLTLHAGPGNGSLDLSDFASGRLVTGFSAFDATPFNVLDVTATVNALLDEGAPFVAFVVRPNPGASSSSGAFLYSSNEISDAFGFQPTRLDVNCPTTTVALDIKPSGSPNPVNPGSAGLIPVAVLSSSTFDAAGIDATSIRFGRTGTEASPVRWALEDADGDGDTDLVVHFDTRETGIACGDMVASLTGALIDGKAIAGSDAIRTVGCD
jgi:hypothetical protein